MSIFEVVMNRDLTKQLNAYLRLGLTVIPLRPRCKKPLVKWSASDWNPTASDIRKWANRPDINIGLRCGEDIAVLDFDDPGRYEDFSFTHPVPEDAPVVRTSRGYHIWIRPKSLVSTQHSANFEIKCCGSYVVVPPSVSRTGHTYCFLRYPHDSLPTVDLEQWLGAQLRGNNVSKVRHTTEEFVELLQKTLVVGERRPTLIRIAGYLRFRGIPEDVAVALVLPWAEKRFSEHLSKEEIEKHVRGIYKRYGVRGLPVDEEQVLDRVPEDLQKNISGIWR